MFHKFPVRLTSGQTVSGEVGFATPADVENFGRQISDQPKHPRFRDSGEGVVVQMRQPGPARHGVCCVCQETHLVVPSSGDPEDVFWGSIFGGDGNWVMAPHEAFGLYCQGEGTAPQALVNL